VGSAAALGPALDRARNEWPEVVARRAAADVLGHLGDARAAAVRIETAYRANVAELERQRLPDPPAFRTALLHELTDAIEAASRDVETKSLVWVREGIEKVKREWTTAIETCNDKPEVEACVARLRETAAARFATLLDGLAEGVLREMQSASERLQAVALERIREQYKSRRVYEDAASPVIIEMPDEHASIQATSLGAAFEVFEKRRVELGIGGATAGAMLGTAILPGIGTAIGAIVGVLAGFVEGTSTLKRLCVQKAREHVDRVGLELAARFDKTAPQHARDIRASVDAMVAEALHQREGAILRLMDVESRVLAREEEKLGRVVALRDNLQMIEVRFARVEQGL
jgi:hypothetical protein